jgi:hypothetical protein
MAFVFVSNYSYIKELQEEIFRINCKSADCNFKATDLWFKLMKINFILNCIDL